MTTMGVALDGSTDGPPPVSVSDEAIALLIVENCEVKWNCQVRRELAGKKQDEDKMKRMVLYTTSSGGSCMFGAWSKEGRLRFKEIRAKIKKGRASPEGAAGERQCRRRLFKKHGMQKKLDGRKKKGKPTVPIIDLAGAEVGFGSGDEDDAEMEECRSDGEEGEESGADDSDDGGGDDETVGREEEEDEPKKKRGPPKKSKNPLKQGVVPRKMKAPEDAESVVEDEGKKVAAKTKKPAKDTDSDDEEEDEDEDKKVAAKTKKPAKDTDSDDEEEEKMEDEDEDEEEPPAASSGSKKEAGDVEEKEGEHKN
jgi:hypothetical protein